MKEQERKKIKKKKVGAYTVQMCLSFSGNSLVGNQIAVYPESFYLVALPFVASIPQFVLNSRMAAGAPTSTSAFLPVGRNKGKKGRYLPFKGTPCRLHILSTSIPSFSVYSHGSYLQGMLGKMGSGLHHQVPAENGILLPLNWEQQLPAETQPSWHLEVLPQGAPFPGPL